jgi:uncharacterized protein
MSLGQPSTFERQVRQKLESALSDTPVVLLQGARQVGKTTLTRTFATYSYFTLDNAATLGLAKSDPTGFIAGLPEKSVIDEIQLAPELLPAIKERVDNNRKPGMFLLTGSANVLLLPKVSESLAGRMDIIVLSPLSQSEIAGTQPTFIADAFQKRTPKHTGGIAKTELCKRILEGGYPEPRQRQGERRQDWFDAYLTTILSRDIRDLANIEGMAQLPRLLALLAARSANLLNLSDIGNSAKIPYTTLQRYMALLEATFLVKLIPAWSNNLTNRFVKAPKLYLLDSALTAALLGADENQLERNSTLYGALLETFAVNELHKLASWSQVKSKPFHFRTHTQHEVDVVLERMNGECIGVEIKASSTVTPKDFRGLQTLQSSMPERFVTGIILYTGDKVLPFGEGLSAAPITALWA